MSDANVGVAGSRTADAAGTDVRGARETSGARIPMWLKGVGPLILVAALVAVFLRVGPAGVFEQAFPPVEELTIERVMLPAPGQVRVRVVNGGPEAVTIAQVLVNEATWQHDIVGGDRRIGRLENRTIDLAYPWTADEPLEITLITNTGVTFATEIPVATTTPSFGGRYMATFALLGIYVGVIPVFLGLLWLPFLRGIDRRWLDFFLSLTIGLLIFLGVDALAEAFETADGVPGAFQGLGLILFGLVGTPLLLAAIGRRRSTGEEDASNRAPVYVALLIALGIGLHNLGEGLAIGAAYATGEIALGGFLVIGFLLHNTTEGLGIVAPLARERPSIGRLALLGLIAGLPTVAGAWIGGFGYSPLWTTLFFAIGAGAIVQVVWELWRFIERDSTRRLADPWNAAGLMAGLAIMYVTGLFVGA